jgi:acetyl esterase/lipase
LSSNAVFFYTSSLFLAFPGIAAMTYRPVAPLWLAAFIVFSPPFLSAQPASSLKLPDHVAFHPDKLYRSQGNVRRELDIAFPKNTRGPAPGVIVLHGAGTLTKGRKGLSKLILDLAAQGYVGVAVSYNYQPNGDYLDPLHDVKAAVRWLRTEAGAYNLDPSRIGVIGYSAGSCLACLLALTTPKDGLEGDLPMNAPSSQVQAVVGYFGPSDFLGLYSAWTKTPLTGWDHERLRRPLLIGSLERWFGGTPMNNEVAKRYDLLSPLRYVHKDAPPLLLLHGEKDRVIPSEQSKQLYRKLQEKKAPVTLKLFENAGHDFDEDNAEYAREALNTAKVFLKEQLRLGKP